MTPLASAGRPPPIVFQRRAAEWADRIIGWEEKAHIDGLELGVISSLRGLLVMRGGAALRELDVPRNGGGIRAAVEPAAKSLAWQLREWARRLRLRGRPEADRPFALMLPRSPVHLVDMVPVAEQLQRRGRSSWFWCSQLHAAMLARGLEVDHVSESLPAVGRFASRALQLGFKALRPLERKGDEAQAMRRIGSAVVRDTAFELASFSLRAARMLRHRRPKVILVGTPYTLEGRVTSLLAKGAGIPTVALEHGLSFDSDPYWAGCSVDWVGCWGEAGRRALKSSGLRDDRLVLTGAPRLDRFVGRSGAAAPRRVLVATSGAGDQVSRDEHLAFIEALYGAAAGLPDVEWVVKLHPKDQEAPYEEAARRHAAARVALRRGDRNREGVEIYEYLRDAAVLVTVVSATALDALAVSRPVVSVQLRGDGRRDSVEFLRRGAVNVARDADELRHTVSELLEGRESPQVRAAAEQFTAEQFAHRGSSAARVADLMVSLAT